MDWETWRKAYVKNIMDLTGVCLSDAEACADAAKDIYEDDPTIPPAEAVDDEVSCWSD